MNFLAMTHGHAAGQKPGRIDRIGLSGVRARRFGVLGFGVGGVQGLRLWGSVFIGLGFRRPAGKGTLTSTRSYES